MTTDTSTSGENLVATYAQAVEALRAGRSSRAFAAVSGLDPSTVSRLLRAGAESIPPSSATHGRLVDYARTNGHVREATALEDAWRGLGGHRQETDFERVFGREIALGHVALVLPQVRLNPKYVTAEGETSLDFYQKADSSESAGIGHEADLVELGDLEAVLAVREMLRANGAGDSSRIQSDLSATADLGESLSDLPQSLFLFGGFTNAVTVRYCKQPNALFGLTKPRAGVDGSFDVGGHEFSNSDRPDAPVFFLIARFRPDPDRNPGRTCIPCVGSRGRGTRAAGRFLRDDWRWFTRLPADRDFAAVFSTSLDGNDPELEVVESHAT